MYLNVKNFFYIFFFGTVNVTRLSDNKQYYGAPTKHAPNLIKHVLITPKHFQENQQELYSYIMPIFTLLICMY